MASSKKKKKYVGLLALIILCGMLFAGYALILKMNEEEEEETASETLENLFEDLSNTDILEITYRVGDDTLTFVRESSDDDWYSTEDETLPIDQSTISSIVSTACSLTINQEIAEDLTNSADFGLEDPVYEVRMTDADGTEYVLYIGDTTASSTSRRYAYVEGDERILSISTTIVSKLNTDLQSLVSVDSFPSFDEEDIITVYYEDATQTMELFNSPEDLTTAEATGTTTWYYLEDGVYMPVNQTNSATMIDAITGLSFDSCVNYSADDDEMEGYGLLEPVAILQIDYTVSEDTEVETETTDDEGNSTTTVTTTTEEQVIVYIGYKCEDDEDYYYVSMNDGRTVYKLDAETVEIFTENVLSDYCMSLYPTLTNFDGIEQIDVTYGDLTMQITVTQTQETDDDGNETTVYNCTLNGEEFDEDTTRTIFSSLISVTADHIIADEDIKTDGEVVFSCTYQTSYEKKSVITIEITEYDTTYYQLSLNGNAKYAITKQEFNSLIYAIEEYLE